MHKKLLINKLLDGDARLVQGTETLALLAQTQKFCFNTQCLKDMIIATAGGKLKAMVPLARAPFPLTWIENETGTHGMLCIQGTLDFVVANIPVYLEGAAELVYASVPVECQEEVTAVVGISRHPKYSARAYAVYPAVGVSSSVVDPVSGKWVEVAVPLKYKAETETVLPVRVREAKHFLWEAMFDWMALNVKNATTSESVEFTPELNAARARKNKPPLKNYTYIGSNMSTPDTGAAQSGKSPMAHVVRGHFKERKTGTYWWNPHIAGKGEVKEREGYKFSGSKNI